ncbi:hypothetical protein Pint_36538 [Pistacia integerrima]|uniref:Uncharacterized protein n=1 Tax=Pistacia integerrima TaxID=434235 RepID=A0ACC0Y306_9ROSI|nr:hypothetical protein Pint_36538 [Pistacia integerrima]
MSLKLCCFSCSSQLWRIHHLQTSLTLKFLRHIPNSDLCLINNGKLLQSGKLLTFRYSTTFKFLFSVASVRCRLIIWLNMKYDIYMQ